jgi:hypothetical protein
VLDWQPRVFDSSEFPSVIVHPTVNRTVRKTLFIWCRCSMKSWVAPAPSARTRILRRYIAGICAIASARTRMWSDTVFDPALPGRSSIARDSVVFAHHAPSGWKP